MLCDICAEHPAVEGAALCAPCLAFFAAEEELPLIADGRIVTTARQGVLASRDEDEYATRPGPDAHQAREEATLKWRHGAFEVVRDPEGRVA